MRPIDFPVCVEILRIVRTAINVMLLLLVMAVAGQMVNVEVLRMVLQVGVA